jgi:hypothetical protein
MSLSTCAVESAVETKTGMANPNPIPRPENLRPWKPSESGNPQGHSQGRRLTDALKRKLAEPGRESLLAEAWYDAALSGSYPHLREILDRTEGKVASKVEVTENKIDWSALDNEGDTERPSASAQRAKSLPEGGEA